MRHLTQIDRLATVENLRDWRVAFHQGHLFAAPETPRRFAGTCRLVMSELYIFNIHNYVSLTGRDIFLCYRCVGAHVGPALYVWIHQEARCASASAGTTARLWWAQVADLERQPTKVASFNPDTHIEVPAFLAAAYLGAILDLSETVQKVGRQ